MNSNKNNLPASYPDVNVFGEPIEPCSTNPMTGWLRDGCCRTDENDFGTHTICAQVTAEFLKFSKSRGNDLSTPRPEFHFKGLSPGDNWCLCARRWLEAHEENAAPSVYLRRTHKKTTEIVPFHVLRDYAVDLD